MRNRSDVHDNQNEHYVFLGTKIAAALHSKQDMLVHLFVMTPQYTIVYAEARFLGWQLPACHVSE